MPCGSARTTSSRPAASSASSDLRLGGVAPAPRGRSRGSRPRNRKGCWGIHASCSAPRLRCSSSSSGTPADAHASGLGASRPSRTEMHRRLAAPARPGQREHLPGADRQGQLCTGGHGSAGVGGAQLFERDRRARRGSRSRDGPGARRQLTARAPRGPRTPARRPPCPRRWRGSWRPGDAAADTPRVPAPARTAPRAGRGCHPSAAGRSRPPRSRPRVSRPAPAPARTGTSPSASPPPSGDSVR